MTNDTVPVPREWLEKMSRLTKFNTSGLGATIAADVSAMLAAAPQEQLAEPRCRLCKGAGFTTECAPNGTTAYFDCVCAEAEHPSRASKAEQPALESVPRDEPVAWIAPHALSWLQENPQHRVLQTELRGVAVPGWIALCARPFKRQCGWRMSMRPPLPDRSLGAEGGGMIVDGREWHEFAIDYTTPDGEFRASIYALSHEHAQLMLADLKENGRVAGQIVHREKQ